MSCGGGKATFRLLDAYVGWDAIDPGHSQLTGFDDPIGISLVLANPGAADPALILAYLLPARLARGCGACEWYLVTPRSCGSRLLRRGACQRDWTRVWPSRGNSELLIDGVAVAAWGQTIAVSDPGANRVLIWEDGGERLRGEIAIDAPGPIAFTPGGELLISTQHSNRVARYGRDGIPRGSLRAALPDATNRIAVDRESRVWVVSGDQEESWILWRAGLDGAEFQSIDAEELKNTFPPTGLVAASAAGFCMDEPDSTGVAVAACFSWCGQPLSPEAVTLPQPPRRRETGQLLTGALDSGIPRCRWHRVRVDADVPTGTALSIAVATTDDAHATAQGDPSRDPGWTGFPAGQPHFKDWTTAPAGALDFLIDQPSGRYLFFRIRFTGNGVATPVVRRVHVDFPRLTSLDRLPAVFREDPQAGDFTERFLGLFDASIADVDRIIERYPSLLDASAVPEQLLPWLATFFDIGFDSTWVEDKRRALLQNAAELYRQRGTVAGLQLALKLVFGISPAIEELPSTGTWGQIGDPKALRTASRGHPDLQAMLHRTARLGRVRLFGKARSRFRLGGSPLSGAPLRSFGNPDQDPFTAGAYRVRLLVPPLADKSPQERERLMRLIEAQTPAHTIASLRVGGTGFLLGKWSAVGVDTALVPLAAPVLGRAGNVRLSRTSILGTGSRGRFIGPVLGSNSVVGIQTIAG